MLHSALILLIVVWAPRSDAIVSDRLGGNNSGLVCEATKNSTTGIRVSKGSRDYSLLKRRYVLHNGSPSIVGLNDLDTLWSIDSLEPRLQVAAGSKAAHQKDRLRKWC